MIYILMTFITNIQTTDSQDKLFGIIGIIQGPSEELNETLIPDYHKPTSQVFTDLSRYLIEGTNTLIPLYACVKSTDDMASWVSSWIPMQRSICFLREHASVRPPGPKPCIGFSKNLHACGAELGRVHTFLSRVCDVPELKPAYCSSELVEAFTEWEREILATGLIKVAGKHFQHMYRDVFLYGLEFGTKEVNNRMYDGIRDLAEVPMSENKIEDAEVLDMFCTRVVQNIQYEVVFVTDQGLVGRTYDQVSVDEGDIICFLQGGYSPLILSPHDDGFKFMGSCMLYDHMDNKTQADMLNDGPCRTFDIF
jgi:hypothetical protein